GDIVVEYLLPGHLWIVALLRVERQRPCDGLRIIATRPGNGPRSLERLGIREIEQARAHDDAGRKAGAVLEDDIDSATDALAVEVGGRRSDNFDPVDDLGRYAVDEHRSVIAATGDGATVDEDLGKAGAKSPQGRRIIFANVA